MENWVKVTLILCAFGTLREIRPSEPFVSEFLLGEWRNVTEEQLTREVYPVGTYSYFALLVVVFLVTDFLRFNPVIIISGLSGIVVYAILLWTTSLEWLQATQFLYGLYMATEVAYFTYIYAKVDSEKYPLVTSYTRIGALTGRFLSGLSSQLLIYFQLMNYRQLNYITFAAQILASFWALWLPKVKYSIYFHRRTSTASETKEANTPNTQPIDLSLKQRVFEACWLILRHARAAYSRPRVVAWSAVYATSLALYVQTQYYVQLLWIGIQKENNLPSDYMSLNGAAEAATTLLGAGGAWLAARCCHSVLPALVSAAQALALLRAVLTTSLVESYAGYVVTGVMFHYVITLASAKIANQLADESCFGLIFGINTFIGTGLQSILTLVLIQAIDLSINVQYYVLSGLYLLQALVWLIGWVINKWIKRKAMFTLPKTS